MNEYEKLAEEGLAVVEKLVNFVINIPLNAFITAATFLFAVVGWLSRHLTTLALDAGDSPACEGEQSPEVLSAGEVGQTPAPRQ